MSTWVEPLMNYTSLPKSTCTQRLTRLRCPVTYVNFQNSVSNYSFNVPSSPEKTFTEFLGVNLSPAEDVYTQFDAYNHGIAQVFYVAQGRVTSSQLCYSAETTQRSCLRGLQRVLVFLNAVSNLGCHISLSPTRGVSSRWHLVLGHSS